uniref:hypothetical protein n=1 Tax=uncultured Azohydromonas sp. TaxID=487342 RepID=UPI00262B5D9A
ARKRPAAVSAGAGRPLRGFVASLLQAPALRPQRALAQVLATAALAIPVVPAVLTPERTKVSVAYLMAEPAPYEGRTAARTVTLRESANTPVKRRFSTQQRGVSASL